jgi:outer membrane protein assembly factor BamA
LSVKVIISISFIIFCFGSFKNSYSQQPDSVIVTGNFNFVVDSIKINGNKSTKDFIILRELTFKVGDTVNPGILQYNRERIFSLDIFTKVELIPARVRGTNILYIEVEESWYIYPIPFVELTDRDWKKISFGMYFVLKNFRGRNEVLSSRVSFGYDPSFLISYYTPYLIQDESVSLRANAEYINFKNKSYTAKQLYGADFNQKFILGSLTLGKRFGLYNRFDLGLEYDYIETPFYIHGVSASDGRIDRVPVISLTYDYDTRDLIQFPKEGMFASASVNFKGLGLGNINYQITRLDFREYFSLTQSLSFKYRLATRFTSGKNIPFYDFSFLGYTDRIRGHFFEEREGNNSYIGSAQFDYPIMKDFNLTLDFIPIIPRELLTYRVGVYLELFGDTGATKFLGRPLSFKNFTSGYGSGLTFLFLPYNVFRIEFALDEYHHTEWILDIGTSF